jgi:hypothetical protein
MRGRITLEEAKTTALNVLGYLADSPESLQRLMDQSGLDSSTIRKRAADRDFLCAVMDFLMADEGLLVDFCQSTNTEPRAVQMACHVLSNE